MRGVVITGCAALCGLGASLVEAVDALQRGETGFNAATALESGSAGFARAAQARDGAIRLGDGPDRAERLLASALTQALAVAPRDRGLRVGVVLGTTLAGMRHWGAFIRGSGTNELVHANASAVLAEAMRLSGLDCASPAITVSAACASGLTAIRLGAAMLALDRADVVLAGGYDTISEFTFAGFSSLRLIAATVPRPFDAERDGMRIGEGAGIVVLERGADARARGRSVIALIVGAGESSDAHHLTQPHPEGAGAARAIGAAMADDDARIELIIAHATATPNNDAAEYAAYATAFGEGLGTTPVVALKSRLGHTLGAAGALELVLGVECLRRGSMPTTAALALVDRASFPKLDLIDAPRQAPTAGDVLVTSLGFGGANACLRVRCGAEAPQSTPLTARTVVVTALGAVLPEGSGLDALRDAATTAAGTVPEANIAGLIDARRARRLSAFARLVLATASDVVARSGLTSDQVSALGAIVGTHHGAVEYSDAFYRGLITEGTDLANPLQFAESVPNIGSAHVSLGLALRGATISVVGRRSAGLEALDVAAVRIAVGLDDALLVVAADELVEPMLGVMREFKMCDGNELPASGNGGVGLLLESESHARRRGARALARITSAASVARAQIGAAGTARAVRDAINRLGGAAPVLLGPARSWIDRCERVGANGAHRAIIEHRTIAELQAAGPLLRVVLALAANPTEPFAVVAADPFGAASAVSFAPGG